MSNHQKNWEVRSLGDWGIVAESGFASGKHNVSGTGVIHLRPMNIDREGRLDFTQVKSVAPDVSSKRIESGDVLFNNTNSPELVGKTTIFEHDGPLAYSNHMTRLQIPPSIDPKYVAVLLHSLWRDGYFKEICSNHVNQASVSTKRLLQVEVALPPLDVQKRIVETLEDHLSRLDKATLDLKGVERGLLVYWESLLYEQFEKNGSSERVSLGDVAEIVMGQAPAGADCNKSGVGIPFVKVGEFRNSVPEICEWTTNPLKLAREGDVLICVVGATVGKLNLGIDAAIGRSVAALRPNSRLLQSFLFRFLQSKVLEIRASSKGSAQGVITRKQLLDMRIPCPPLEVQHSILQALEDSRAAIDLSMRVLHNSRNEIEKLRRSLLNSAFTGQLVK